MWSKLFGENGSTYGWGDLTPKNSGAKLGIPNGAPVPDAIVGVVPEGTYEALCEEGGVRGLGYLALAISEPLPDRAPSEPPQGHRVHLPSAALPRMNLRPAASFGF